MGNEWESNEGLLKAVLAEIDDLLGEVVLVGGVATLLFVDDGVRDIRATTDVDVLVSADLKRWYEVESLLRARGFTPDSNLICRFVKGRLVIDVMPSDPRVLGFSNRWYAGAIETAENRTLGDRKFKATSFPYFVATKLEAFLGRGRGDFYGSKDIEDLIAVLAGRKTAFRELRQLGGALGEYIRATLRSFMASNEFQAAVVGHLPRDLPFKSERFLADLDEFIDS